MVIGIPIIFPFCVFRLRFSFRVGGATDGAMKFFHCLDSPQQVRVDGVIAHHLAVQDCKHVLERICAPFIALRQIAPLREALGSGVIWISEHAVL